MFCLTHTLPKRRKIVNVVVTVFPVKYQKFAACRLEG